MTAPAHPHRRLLGRVVAGAAVLLVGVVAMAVLASPAAAAAHPNSPARFASAVRPLSSRVAATGSIHVVTSTPSTTVPSVPPGIGVGITLPGTSPTTPPASGTVKVGGGGGCGLFDVSCHVTSAINGWFKGLVTSALNPILSLLGRSVLATPDVGGGKIAALWGVTVGIADALAVLLVLIGGAVVMSHETLQTRYAAKDIAPRIVVAIIAANASLSIIRLAVPAVNSLSQALLGPGVNPATATAAMRQLVVAQLGSGGIFVVLLGLVAARAGGHPARHLPDPRGPAGHADRGRPPGPDRPRSPQTERLARLWWRTVAGLFAIQLAQSLVLICAVELFFTPWRFDPRSAGGGRAGRRADRDLPAVGRGPHTGVGVQASLRRPTQRPGPDRESRHHLQDHQSRGRPGMTKDRASVSPDRVRIPADVDRPDKLLAGLTARQLCLLAVPAVAVWLAYTATKGLLPLPGLRCHRGPDRCHRRRGSGRPPRRDDPGPPRRRRDPPDHRTAPDGSRARRRGRATSLGRNRSATPARPAASPALGVDEDATVDLGDDGTARICAASAVGFSLRTPAEQQALVAGFARYLNSLATPVQILIRSEPVNLEAHIAELRHAAGGLPHPALEASAQAHADFLAELTTGRDLLARQTLLVLRVPVSAAPLNGEIADVAAAGRLARLAGDTTTALAAAGITITALDDQDSRRCLHAAADPWGPPPVGTCPTSIAVTAPGLWATPIGGEVE